MNPIYVETTNKRRIWPLFAMSTFDSTRRSLLGPLLTHIGIVLCSTVGLTVGLLMYMRSSGGVGGLVGDSFVS